MANLRTKLRRASAVFLSFIMAASVFASMPAASASAASYDEMSALDRYAYSGNDLGAVYSKSGTTFKVWAPTATAVNLKRYATGSDSESGAKVLGTVAMTNNGSGLWSTTVSGDIAGTYYTYLITNDGVQRETVDIYARSTGVNGMRGMVIDLDSTDPVGWENDKRVECENQTDAVIWEIHVRDFSISSDSGMTNKGKYLAFTETGTTVNNDGVHPTGIDYLADLGVTHVHLLPVYDYGSVDETKLSTDQFNWGYDPMNYNTPEGSYSTNPYDGNVRVKEFKQMVQALHSKGIGVVMDVVYNHTYSGSSNINDWFNYTVPGYYYRQNSKGGLSNASGCGNETASDRAMYQKFMIDSLKYWATEYHLDGFRFDLMGIHDTDTMNKIRTELDTIDPDILIYGEPWTADSTPCPKPTAVQGNMSLVSEEVAAFNDKVRDAIKGSCFNAADKGFIQGAGYEYQLKGGIQGNTTVAFGDNDWSKQPSQTVTYTSAHDNYTLYDKLVKSVNGGSGYGNRDDTLVQMNKMAGGIILTSQGMSFFQAGEEFARSKYGDENSYSSPTSTNQLVWQNTITYSDLVAYYKGMIQIRKAYAPFRDPTNTSNNTIYFAWAQSGFPSNVVAFTMYNKLSTDGWNFAAVIHNANSTSKTVTLMTYDGVALPSQWVIVANGTKAGLESLGTSGSTVTVPARSTMVLIDKTSFDNTTFTKKGTVTVNHINQETGSVIRTETLKGEIGASYSTSASSELISQGYTVSRIAGNTTGTYTETDATVSYYYSIDPEKIGTVIINYYADPPYPIAQSETYSGVIGTSYSFSPKKIPGYECDISQTSNASGTYKKGTITINFIYYEAEDSGVKVHYYNSSGWSQVAMYLYNEDSSGATLYSGSWPGTLMTNDGDGWYSAECSTVDSALFIANNNVAVYGQQDPSVSGESGYKVSGEVWIKNGKVYPTGKVIVIYRCDTAILDRYIITGIADGTKTYSTSPKEFEGMTLKTVTNNTSGVIGEGVTTVQYVYEPEISTMFANTSTVSATEINAGEKIIISGSAVDGTAPYSFTYAYRKSGKTAWTSFGSGTSAVFKPGEGTFELKVTATDNSGATDDKLFTIKVKAVQAQLTNNSTVSAASIALGDKVTINAKAAGGTAPYTYTYAYQKAGKTTWTSFGSGTAAVFKPGAGVFTIKVTAKDSAGASAEKTFTVSCGGSSPLTNNSTVSATSIALGDKITITAKAAGGTAPYTYTYEYQKYGKTTWTSFGKGTAAVFKPGEGVFTIKVTAKDSTGITAEKTFKISCGGSSTPLTNSTTISSTSVALGGKFTISAKASGGTAPYTYTYEYQKSGKTTWTSFGSGSTAVFKPGVGAFTVRVTVTDSFGMSAEKLFTVTVT